MLGVALVVATIADDRRVSLRSALSLSLSLARTATSLSLPAMTTAAVQTVHPLAILGHSYSISSFSDCRLLGELLAFPTAAIIRFPLSFSVFV